MKLCKDESQNSLKVKDESFLKETKSIRKRADQYKSNPSTSHRRTNHENEPILCLYAPECDRTFDSHSKMKRHLLIHTGEKNYSCPVCHWKFSLEYNMKVHYQKIHSKDMPHECGYPGCFEKFAQKSFMIVHMQVHENPEYNQRILHRRAIMEGRINDNN